MVGQAAGGGRYADAGDERLQQGWVCAAARSLEPKTPSRRLRPLHYDPDPPGRRSQPPDPLGPPAAGPTGKVCGVPLCPEAAAATGPARPAPRSAASRQPPASGSPPVDSPAGQTPDRYLSGRPLKGAPYSMVSCVPARPVPSTSVWSSTAPRSTSTPITPPRRSRPTRCRRCSKGCRWPTAPSTSCRPARIHVESDRLQPEADPRDPRRNHRAVAGPTDAFQATNCASFRTPQAEADPPRVDPRPAIQVSAILTQTSGQANNALRPRSSPAASSSTRPHQQPLHPGAVQCQFLPDEFDPRHGARTPLLEEPFKGPLLSVQRRRTRTSRHRRRLRRYRDPSDPGCLHRLGQR